MEVILTEELKKFVTEIELSDKKIEEISNIIGAFSEYIVATNPNYVYNKTYLKSYIEDFVRCQKNLKLKIDILNNQIVKKIRQLGITDNEYRITIDEVVKFENGNLKLNDYIDSRLCMDKMKVEIEFVHENDFVIAEEINGKENYEKSIAGCVLKFVNRRKEILDEK